MFTTLPFWAIFLLTAAAIYAAMEAGHISGARVRGRGDGTKEELGSMVAAMLGLLGFILAITFGTQLQRFDTGKTLLLDEANAIHATWLRAGMLPEPYQNDARRILRDYVDVRMDSSRPVDERIVDSETMQSALWEIVMAGLPAMDEGYPNELLPDSLNQLISLHEQRVTVTARQHMPGAFWLVLYALTLLTFALAGYNAGAANSSRTAARPISVLGFSLLVLLIADLDRPGRGALTLDQQALEYVAQRMDNHADSNRGHAID